MLIFVGIHLLRMTCLAYYAVHTQSVVFKAKSAQRFFNVIPNHMAIYHFSLALFRFRDVRTQKGFEKGSSLRLLLRKDFPFLHLLLMPSARHRERTIYNNLKLEKSIVVVIIVVIVVAESSDSEQSFSVNDCFPSPNARTRMIFQSKTFLLSSTVVDSAFFHRGRPT